MFISRKEFSHGDVTVRVTQVKNAGYKLLPYTCRAWFEVRKDNRLIKRQYYDDIDPSGFSYGIFVPKQQPIEDYFVAVKEGDYDGRLLLVSRDGALSNLPGGFYFLTDDKRFLLEEYASDDSSLVVVDVSMHKMVIDARDDSSIPEVLNWYRDTVGYFFTEPDPASKAWPPTEKRGHVYRLDLRNLKVTKIGGEPRMFANAHKVSYDFDPRKKRDCSSEPQ